MLRKEFHETSTEKKSNKVLLSFGSTDPFCITEKVLDLLCKEDNKLKHYENLPRPNFVLHSFLLLNPSLDLFIQNITTITNITTNNIVFTLFILTDFIL